MNKMKCVILKKSPLILTMFIFKSIFALDILTWFVFDIIQHSVVHGVELINGGFGMKNPIIAHAQDQRILTPLSNACKHSFK